VKMWPGAPIKEVSGDTYARANNRRGDSDYKPLPKYRLCAAPNCWNEISGRRLTCSGKCRVRMHRQFKGWRAGDPKPLPASTPRPRLLPTRKAWNKGIKTGRAAYAIGHVIVPLRTKRSTPKKTD
jgi:hypothetical protein